jgi:hypothetical protein
MRLPFAALALAGALHSCAPAYAVEISPEPRTHIRVAQMARDVTASVRAQRQQSRKHETRRGQEPCNGR